jgi:hypothetical protein
VYVEPATTFDGKEMNSTAWHIYIQPMNRTARGFEMGENNMLERDGAWRG